jgi:hypothetical protein
MEQISLELLSLNKHPAFVNYKMFQQFSKRALTIFKYFKIGRTWKFRL